MKLSRCLARAVHTSTIEGSLVARSVVQAPRSPEDPVELQLRSLGSGPGALVQVELPPSTPFYARRNALAGVLGSLGPTLGLGVIARSIVLGQPITRLLARQPLTAQRVLSTTPVTLLVGSKKHACLAPLTIDGTVDWVVTSPATVDAFAGVSARAHTSWAIGAYAPLAHVLVKGRGAAVLATPGPVTSLQVEAGETVLVHRKFLAAFSVDPLKRVPAKQVDLAYSFKQAARLPAAPALPDSAALATDSTAQRVWQMTRRAVALGWRALHALYTLGSTSLKRGNGQFVQISGPSTVLVTSAQGAAEHGEPTLGPNPGKDIDKKL